MLGLFARMLLFLAAGVTSWFVAKNAENFSVFQMIVAVLLFVAVLFAAAFWPSAWIRKLGQR
ncbi:MAG: hypothetical protein OSA97_13515 [Nevskia sp.]|nr:hypothetical protein [Nevskia sp.]